MMHINLLEQEWIANPVYIDGVKGNPIRDRHSVTFVTELFPEQPPAIYRPYVILTIKTSLPSLGFNYTLKKVKPVVHYREN